MQAHIQKHDIRRLISLYQSYTTICERNTNWVKSELRENTTACEAARTNISTIERTIRHMLESMNCPNIYPELRFEYMEQLEWLETEKKQRQEQLSVLEKQRTKLSSRIRQYSGRLDKTQERLRYLQGIQQRNEENTLLEYWSNYRFYEGNINDR